ncbi:MAG: Spo0E family sporulation regulatory protein-aspartic acid phosphatase [Bacillota bacterium]
MDKDMHSIIKLIEKKRAELSQLVMSNNKIDECVIKKSQELDLLLNEFNNTNKEKAAK